MSFDCDQVLDAAPLAVVAADEQNNVIWLNAAARALLPGILPGRSLTALPPAWQQLITADEVTQTGDRQYLSCQRLTLAGTESVTVYFLLDVTEQEQLRQQVKRLQRDIELKTLRDEHTGLLNRFGLMQMLDMQVSRSRRYYNSLALIQFGFAADDYVSRHYQQVLQAIAYKLNDQMRWADMIGSLDEQSLLFILPETTKETAQQLVDKINSWLQTLTVSGRAEPLAVRGNFGIVQWCEGDDPRKLLARANEAMGQARQQNRLVASL